MTSRERVLRAVAHEATDRIPVDYITRTDVMNKLITYLSLPDKEALFRKLGIDIRKTGVAMANPVFQARTNGVLGGRSERSGHRYIFHPDGTYEDSGGIIWRASEDGLYDEWVRGPFTDDPDMDKYPWPDPQGIESVESIAKRLSEIDKEYALFGTFNYPFKVCWQMRGLENFLCDMLLEPDFARALWIKTAEYETEKALRFIKAGGDIVGFSGDIAMQDRMMVSPSAWREIDKPLFAEMIAKFKAEKPDVLVFYHSDGNMEEVIPDLVEIGVDIIDPIQPESMDVGYIKEKYGKDFTLHGTISIQQMLPHGTLEDVRKETEHRISLGKDDGGMIIAPANHVQNDTPLENIIEIYRTVGSFQA
jgi:uroporphyrinogen decarboxylase